MKFEHPDITRQRTASLTERQVRKIIRDFANGKRGTAEAYKYNISPNHYNRIGRRQAWEHLK